MFAVVISLPSGTERCNRVVVLKMCELSRTIAFETDVRRKK